MLTRAEHPITKLAWRLYPKIKLHFLCDPSQKSLGSYSLDYTDERFIEVVQTARRFIYAIHRLRTDTGTTAKLRSKAKIRKTDFHRYSACFKEHDFEIIILNSVANVLLDLGDKYIGMI